MTSAGGTDAAPMDEQVIHLPASGQKGARLAPYASEVKLAMRQGHPNVFIFAGPRCWERAAKRRIQFGLGTSLVLPNEVSPEHLTWPGLDAIVVAWPEHDELARARKLILAQALIRDGVRYAAIEHAPSWIGAWRAGAQPHD